MPLTITLPEMEVYNEGINRFQTLPSVTLRLEHSLVALSKWEAIFGKPFLKRDEEKTPEEIYAYIQAMSDEEFPLEFFQRFTQEHFDAINAHIDSKMTATWFRELPGDRRPTREIVTAELIYYWMITLGVPMEFENWHLSRLFTQLKVINEKNTPKDKQQKMSKAEIAARNRELNAQRRAQMGTKG